MPANPLPPGVTIVPIAEAHIAGLNRAVDIVARERRYLAMTEGPSVERTAVFVRGNIESGNPQLVALSDGEVIGWCDIVRPWHGGLRHSGVLGMGLVPEWRGKGIGRALIVETVRRGQALGLTRIELTVHAGNANAARLYERVGFVREGVKRKAFLVDGRYDDSIMMALVT